MRWWLTVLLLAGCTQAPSPLDDPGPEGPEPARSYRWQTDGPGPLLHSVAFVAPGGWCKVTMAATGDAPDYSDTMVAMVEADERWLSISSGQQELVEAHASVQLLGAEQHIDPGRAWADHLEINRTWAAGQNVTLTLAALHLDGSAAPFWAHDALEGAAAVLHISCESPLQIQRTYNGTDVVIFSETTFSGGASVHAHGLGETGAQAVNKVSLTTQEPRGRLYLDHRGDLLLQHVAAGAIVIRSPEGEQVVLDHPAALAMALAGVIRLQYEVDAGPGTYEVEATYASVDILGDIQGFLLGAPW